MFPEYYTKTWTKKEKKKSCNFARFKSSVLRNRLLRKWKFNQKLEKKFAKYVCDNQYI